MVEYVCLGVGGPPLTMYREKFHLSNQVIKFSFKIGLFWATGQPTNRLTLILLFFPS